MFGPFRYWNGVLKAPAGLGRGRRSRSFLPGTQSLESRFVLEGGNTLRTASDLGALVATQTLRGSVGTADRDDFYRFNLPTPATVNALLNGLSADADLQLIRDANSNGAVDPGDVLVTSAHGGTAADSISRALAAGTYYVRVYQYSGDTNYNLTLTATVTAATPIVFQAEAGTGGGQLRDRSNATGNGNFHQTRWMRLGDEVAIPFTVTTTGRYRLDLRYSRDSYGPGPTASFWVDDRPVGALTGLANTNAGGPPGAAWNVFRTASLVDPIQLLAGQHVLRLRVDGGDIWGIEADSGTFYPV